jgi:hypothetical protein
VAEVFERDLGDPSLLRLLEGPGESNPLVRWQEALGRARERIEALEYGEAARALEELLIDVRGMSGSGSDRYLPVTYGSLGECFFQAGEAALALLNATSSANTSSAGSSESTSVPSLTSCSRSVLYLVQAAIPSLRASLNFLRWLRPTGGIQPLRTVQEIVRAQERLTTRPGGGAGR